MLPDEKADNRILKVCKGLAERCRDGNRAAHITGGETEEASQVILVTKDILLRIKAQIIGIRAEDFTTEQVSDKAEQYLGRTEVCAPEELFKEFKKKGISTKEVYITDENGKHSGLKLEENEFIILKAESVHKEDHAGESGEGADPGTGLRRAVLTVSHRGMPDSIFCRRR